MCRYNGIYITHATMTCLNCISVKIFWNKCVGRKFLFKRFKKTLPILVSRFEYGGLNQIILRLRFCLSLVCGSDGVLGLKTTFSWNSHLVKASLYVLILFLKISSSDDNLEILLLMYFQIYFLTLFRMEEGGGDKKKSYQFFVFNFYKSKN